MQAHTLLADRLVLDDPDNLQARAVVARRSHGTAMASLILHGDRNENGPTLKRPLYVRPLMVTTEDGAEQTENDRLVVDTVYRAILRIKGSEGEQAGAPTVFLINLSMGDVRRPFAKFMSPLARLLDFLADRYNLLFLVSAGNIREPLDIADFDSWTAFEDADPRMRERSVLKALNAAKSTRTILSPAESLNALTIGAQHHDRVATRQGAQQAIDPFQDNTMPNVSSGLGLGYRRMVKPEVFFFRVAANTSGCSDQAAELPPSLVLEGGFTASVPPLPIRSVKVGSIKLPSATEQVRRPRWRRGQVTESSTN